MTELRSFSSRRPIIRAERNGPKTIAGYAAVFYDGSSGTEFQLWDGVVERIAPKAFRDVMDGDTLGLFNHHPDHVLGRTTSGTLRLSVDKEGLRYEIDIDDESPIAKQVTANLSRGDIRGSSFGFTIAADGIEVGEDDGKTIETITHVSRLVDVGPVTFPAYRGTEASVRSQREAIISAIRGAARHPGLVMERDRAIAEIRAATEHLREKLSGLGIDIGA